MQCIASEIKVLRSSAKCSLYAKMERHKLISTERLLLSERKQYGRLASRYRQEARFMVAAKNAMEIDFFSRNNFSDKKIEGYSQKTFPLLADLKSNAILYHRLADICLDIQAEKWQALFEVGDTGVNAEQRKTRIDEMINTMRNLNTDGLRPENDKFKREMSAFDGVMNHFLTP